MGWVNATALLTPCHNLALDLGWPGLRERINLVIQKWSVGLGCGLDGVAVGCGLDVGVHSNSASEAAQTLMVVQLLEFHNHHAMFSSPSKADASALPNAHHSLTLDLKWPRQRKRCKFGLHLSRATHAYKDSALDLCKCTSPTCFSIPLL